jgi:hypothetical protein
MKEFSIGSLERKEKKKKKESQYFYDLEDKVDSKRDAMLHAVIVR